MSSDIVGKAAISIGADTKMFDQQATSGVSSTLKKVGGVVAGYFAVTKVTSFLKDSALAAEEAATANTKLAVTLTNAGVGTADVISRQQALAEAISKTTGVEDEAIKQGQAVLATFHGLAETAGTTGGAFDRATQAAVDLSATGFGSVESASTMLGKALEDPVKGITALSRVGVNLTDAQKEQVKSFMAVNDLAGAQAVVLSAVEGQVGGVAEATANSSDKMAVAWGEVQESVGNLLLPVMDSLASFMVDTLGPAVEDLVAWINDDLKPAIEDAATKFEAFKGWIDDNSTALTIIAGIIAAVVVPGLVVMGVQAVIAGVKAVASWVAQSAAALAHKAVMIVMRTWMALYFVWEAAKWLASTAASAVSWLAKSAQALAWKTVMAGVKIWQGIYWAWEKAQMLASKVADGVMWLAKGAAALAYQAVMAGVWIALKVQQLAAMAVQAIAFAVTIAGWLASAVAAMASAVVIAAAWFIALGPVGWVIAAVLLVIGIFVLLWVKCEAFRDFWKELWDKIMELIKAAVDAIVKWVRDFINDVKQKWEEIKRLWELAKEIFGLLKQVIQDKLDEIKAKIKGWIDDTIQFFKDMPGKLLQVGKDVVSGLWDGIKSMKQWIIDKVVGFVSDILPGPIKNFLGIASPSKLFADIGKEVPRGMALGIEHEAKMVEDAGVAMALGAVPTMPSGASGGGAASAGATTINVTVSMDDLAQLGTLEDFLAMLDKARVQSRRNARSGRVEV